VSLCPGCQHEPRQPDFCERCFRSLQPAAQGRFTGLIAESFRATSPTPEAPVAPNLLTVQFQPTTWNERVLIPGLKRLVPAALALAVVLGVLAYQHKVAYQQSLQHRRNGIALTAQGDFQAAHSQLEQAPEDADTHLARAQLAVAEGHWETAAEELRKGGKSDALVERNVDRVCLERAQQWLKDARQTADHAKALGLCDRAQVLLIEHHGSSTRQSQVHYVRAQILQKMDLVGQSIQELRAALQLDPNHRAAGKLLSQLSPPVPQEPVLAQAPKQAARRPPQVVQIPQMQTQPDYPTYQPPEEDDELELPGSTRSERSNFPSTEQTRRRRSSKSRQRGFYSR